MTNFKWIKVEDKTPPLSHLVLVLTDSRAFSLARLEICDHKLGKRCWISADFYQNISVTHWMKLDHPQINPSNDNQLINKDVITGKCNAKEEFLIHTEGLDISAAIVRDFKLLIGYSEKDFQDFLEKIDFTYNDAYEDEEFGKIWYKDGSWSEREDFGWRTWWKHRTRPDLERLQP